VSAYLEISPSLSRENRNVQNFDIKLNKLEIYSEGLTLKCEKSKGSYILMKGENEKAKNYFPLKLSIKI
jgi:hypothetical protein